MKVKCRFLALLGTTVCCMFFPRRDAAAQATKPVPCPRDTLTTNSGVYTTQQAVRGRDVYAGFCKSCHTPESHTGPLFHAVWDKRFMSELFSFVRDRMPKNEPGSLSDQEYADVIAYLLRMNQMPVGARELPSDTVALRTIRIEPAKSH
jgi:cytochrome c5